MTGTILLGHGSGGKLTHELIDNLFVKYFDNTFLREQSDSAICSINSKNIAFTTDSYVIDPIFFPGGNIGKLAVCGTLNDLAVSGAKPLYISSSFIIEEGFSIENLEKIVCSMADEAKKNSVQIVTGDTKVVEKGKCDKIFINTSGIGIIDDKIKYENFNADFEIGDKIIVNGEIGDHGIAVLYARNSIQIESGITSDCASIYPLINNVINNSFKIKFARDLTRGGLATSLCEISKKYNICFEINEDAIPVKEEVKGACEIFGFDSLYMANEGKIVIFAKKNQADSIIKLLRQHDLGKNSSIIGEITELKKGGVILNTGVGGRRIIEMLSSDQLPRIC